METILTKDTLNNCNKNIRKYRKYNYDKMVKSACCVFYKRGLKKKKHILRSKFVNFFILREKVFSSHFKTFTMF